MIKKLKFLLYISTNQTIKFLSKLLCKIRLTWKFESSEKSEVLIVPLPAGHQQKQIISLYPWMTSRALLLQHNKKVLIKGVRDQSDQILSYNR